MKAAVLYGREDVRVEEVASRALLSGEVRVGIEASLTCGTDLKVFKRGYHQKMIVPPAVFGHEFSGTILETAPDIRDYRVGERVVAANSAPCGDCFHCRQGQENLCNDLLFVNGAYAESIVVPARLVQKNLLRLRPSTAFRDAALTEPLACVVQGIEDVGLHMGQRVLVLGAGPIGLMFLVLARYHGCVVTVSGRGRSRLERARALGAANVLDASEYPDFGTTPGAEGEFDVVIEAVGKPETWEAAVRLVRKGGTVNFFGGCPSGTTVTLDTGLIHYSNLRLLASFHHTPRTIRRALEHIESGVIRAADFIDGECPLSGLPALLDSMTKGNRAVKTMILVHQ
ncbi:MAG TPA: alcohol dehydrogenase catalytic domain-containing protein [Verrucomicrobiae bacterium]|nr:alcohol dehydrogenase catalytic domain-containing protein [Verrucomicrobiae bacterium]